jgi:hypothetical protein
VCDASCSVSYGGSVQETRRREPVFPTAGKRDGIGRKHSEMDVQGNHDLRESCGKRRGPRVVGQKSSGALWEI